MPDITVLDGFGLIVDAKPDPKSAFMKYLRSPASINALLHNGTPLKDLQIGQDPFQSQNLGVSFKETVALGGAGDELTISPKFTATIDIHKGAKLFDEDADPYREKVPISDLQHAYVSAGLKVAVGISGTGIAGKLSFCFAPSSEAILTNYRLFALTDKLVPAVQTLFKTFVIPRDLDDIAGMPEGVIATVEGNGALELSGTATLVSAVNPLALLSTPVALGALSVHAGESVTVRAVVKITGGFQIRVYRLSGSKFQLAFLKKRGSEVDVSVSASAGVSATVGTQDLIPILLKAVSPDPAPDKDAFKKAGLDDKQITAIGAAIKKGIDRSLELAMVAEFDALQSNSAAFVYEVDLDVLQVEGKAAILAALGGNLARIETFGVAGIKPIKSIFSRVRERKPALRVNLLGIFNYGSVVNLLQAGTVVVDEQSGDITITDKASAERIGFTAENFVKDSAKLRRVLAESMLVTVSYRASKTVLNVPELTTDYWFFDFHHRANRNDLVEYVQAAEALGLLSFEEAQQQLESLERSGPLGSASIYINSHYGDPLFETLFLSEGQPRAEEEFEGIGRKAMASIITPSGSIDEARLRVLNESSYWPILRQGYTVFPTFLGEKGFKPQEIADIESDYTAIVWWAGAMRSVAVSLAALLEFVRKNPGAHPLSDRGFVELRKDLDDQLASVVKNTHAHFGKPWGVVVMHLASGRRSKTDLKITSPQLTFAGSVGIAKAGGLA